MSDPTQMAGPLPREIAVRFVPIIRQAAHRLWRRLPTHVCVDDLVGAGFLGLVDAYRRYDPEKCDRFDGYADVRIRGAMLDELRSYDPLSRDLRAFSKRAAGARRALQGRLGRDPDDAEMAAALGMDRDVFRNSLAKARIGAANVSLDEPAEHDQDPHEHLTDAGAIAADERMGDSQAKASLSVAVEALPPRLRKVLELYYGDDLTLRDIGGVLGVTESRICQLHAEAVKKLRASCADGDGLEPPASGPASGRNRPAPRSARASDPGVV